MNSISAKNSRFSSALALTCAFTFALFLALTFVFSLREVRLKIGDYYFKNGNFDQTINWYQTQPTK